MGPRTTQRPFWSQNQEPGFCGFLNRAVTKTNHGSGEAGRAKSVAKIGNAVAATSTSSGRLLRFGPLQKWAVIVEAQIRVQFHATWCPKRLFNPTLLLG